MAKIVIDGKPYEVDPHQNLLHTSLSLGFDLPYFCWHPAMGSVGACRQCAVKQFKDENDTRGKIVMACMTPASEGTRISIFDPEAIEFRASVIEWLMLNHPHDCPVCDEGGECHLQDMTLMTGHSYRRTRFPKRTHTNQYLGPFVHHEMNRCIQCYRCVRFYRDYAGGRDLDVFRAHDEVYFGRSEDGVLQSEFSGNLVEVCPTGVFTDQSLYRHYTRKWDLQTAPSVCVNCSVGCNTIPGERYGKLRRILNRYNREVNGYFICDRGRYGYEFVNSEQRVRQPRMRLERAGETTIVTPEQAIKQLTSVISESSGIIGIGSPRASLEANYALKTLAGDANFVAGISDNELNLNHVAMNILQSGPARSPSLHDIELADAVLILGEDLTNTAPMLAYAVRQAARNQTLAETRKLGIADWDDANRREVVRNQTGPVFVVTFAATKLDDLATWSYHAAPNELARLGFAIAHELDAAAPVVAYFPNELLEKAKTIAQALSNAARPVIISGVSSGSEKMLKAAANIAWALRASGQPAELSLVLPEANSAGLTLLGGESLGYALDVLEKGSADTLVILENDLYRRASLEFVDRLLGAARNLIVIDHLETPTLRKADLALPAATFAEGDGTLVNNEGRAQRFFQAFVPAGDIQESWRWLCEMNLVAGQPISKTWHNLDDIIASLATSTLIFRPITEITPPATFRIVDQKIPRQPHRYSGRTAINAYLSVHEPEPPKDRDAPFNFSMEGYKGEPPGSLIPRYWAPGWNSVQALNKFQSEVAGPLTGGDPGKRLIEAPASPEIRYFGTIPDSFQPQSRRWLIVPFYHIIGSEELSAYSGGTAELVPPAYIAINPNDAQEVGIEENSEIWIEVGGEQLHLPVRIMPSIPQGVSGLPVGLPGMPALDLPAWGSPTV